MNKNFQTDHKKIRETAVVQHNNNLHYLIEQCGKCDNVLYADFRFDIACQALTELNNHKLSLKHLLYLQIKLPIIYPWNCEYDYLKFDVNRRFNVFPLMIIMCETEKQVTASLKLVKNYNLPFAIRAGSHDFEGYSLSNGIIIDQSKRKKIRINLHKNTVEIEPGVLLGPLAEKLSKYKKVFPSGTCANNGATLYTAGGGIGLLSRKFGLACDNIIEIKILLSKGQIVIADKETNKDLYWASTGGGGGNFGIILNIKLKIFDLDFVAMYNLKWSYKNTKEVLFTWQKLIIDAPEDLGSHFRIIGGKTDNSYCTVYGIYLGNIKKLKKILEPLLNIGKPSSDIREVPYLQTAKDFTGIARWLPFFKAKNAYLNKLLPLKAINIIYDYMTLAKPEDVFALESVGGQVNKIKSTETAYPHRDSWTWVLINAHWNYETENIEKINWITEFYISLLPYMQKAVYVNAKDRDIPDYLEQYYAENIYKLVKIKNKYDPHNIFNFEQSIPLKLK